MIEELTRHGRALERGKISSNSGRSRRTALLKSFFESLERDFDTRLHFHRFIEDSWWNAPLGRVLSRINSFKGQGAEGALGPLQE